MGVVEGQRNFFTNQKRASLRRTDGIDHRDKRECRHMRQCLLHSPIEGKNIRQDKILRTRALFPQMRAEPGKKTNAVEKPGMSAEEQAILDVLSSEEASIDSIVTKTGLPAPKVSSTLLALEMKRLARQLPGQRFVKPS